MLQESFLLKDCEGWAPGGGYLMNPFSYTWSSNAEVPRCLLLAYTKGGVEQLLRVRFGW